MTGFSHMSFSHTDRPSSQDGSFLPIISPSRRSPTLVEVRVQKLSPLVSRPYTAVSKPSTSLSGRIAAHPPTKKPTQTFKAYQQSKKLLSKRASGLRAMPPSTPPKPALCEPIFPSLKETQVPKPPVPKPPVPKPPVPKPPVPKPPVPKPPVPKPPVPKPPSSKPPGSAPRPLAPRPPLSRFRQTEALVATYEKSDFEPALSTLEATPAEASYQAAQKIRIHALRKRQGLDFEDGPGPNERLEDCLKKEMLSSTALKPKLGSVGTTRFLAGLVVKADEKESGAKEIAFGQIFRHFGIEAPQASWISETAKRTLVATTPDFQEALKVTDFEAILMPQIKGCDFEAAITRHSTLAQIRAHPQTLLQDIGHMASVDFLIGNNDRLVRVKHDKTGLSDFACINAGNFMFIPSDFGPGKLVAIDNSGMNQVNEENKSEDLATFAKYSQSTADIAKHISRALSRDIVWGTLVHNYQKAKSLQALCTCLGIKNPKMLLEALRDKDQATLLKEKAEHLHEKIKERLNIDFDSKQELSFDPVHSESKIGFSDDEDHSELEIDSDDDLGNEDEYGNFEDEARLNLLSEFIENEDIESSLAKAIIDLEEIPEMFESAEELLLTKYDSEAPDKVATHKMILAKYLGLDSVEEMEENINKGLIKGFQVMKSTNSSKLLAALKKDAPLGSALCIELERIEDKLNLLNHL